MGFMSRPVTLPWYRAKWRVYQSRWILLKGGKGHSLIPLTTAPIPSIGRESRRTRHRDQPARSLCRASDGPLVTRSAVCVFFISSFTPFFDKPRQSLIKWITRNAFFGDNGGDQFMRSHIEGWIRDPNTCGSNLL